MKTILAAIAMMTATAVAIPAAAQSITTEQDTVAADKAEIAQIAKDANGSIYSLPHDEKMRFATLTLKYYIKETFADPDSVKAVITGEPHRVDLSVWQGILGGGNVKYGGMGLCARINGKNAYGAYVGDANYLIIFMEGGRYQTFKSPYLNEFTHEMTENKTVAQGCS